MSTWAEIKAALPACKILVEGWSYRIGDDGTEASLRLEIPAAGLQQLLQRIAGNPPTTLSAYGTTFSRMVPLQFPRDPTIFAYLANAYAPDGTPANTGPADQSWGIDYKFYFVDVSFRNPKWTLANGMIQRERDSSADMRTWPGTALKYPSDGLVINHPVGLPNLQTAFSLTFEGLSSLNDSLYDSMIGCVNINTFQGYAPGTVLYEGCSSSGQYQIAGVPSFRARQQFKFSRIPWRLLMRPDGSGYEAPVWVGDNTKFLFDTADLNTLYG